MLNSFLFGGSTGETPESLTRRRRLADALTQSILGQQPRNAMEGVGAMLKGIGAGISNYRTGETERTNQTAASDFFNQIIDSGSKPAAGAVNAGATPDLAPGNGLVSAAPSGGQDAMRSAAGITGTQSNLSDAGRSLRDAFLGAVRSGGVTNPNALGAIAATGQAESGFSPEHANASWSDPSRNGQAGTAGGILSWRNERLQKLYAFAATRGEQPGAISPETQAAFFLQEDPTLIQKLNAARTPEEAQRLMNNAWRFAGYDQPGGEAERRIGLANAFAPSFQGQGGDTAAGAVNALAEGSPAALPRPAPAGGTGGTDVMAGADPRIIQALANPWISAEQKAVLQTLLQQQMQNADPVRKLQMEKTRRDLATPNLINAGGGQLYNPETGEWISPPPGMAGAGEYGLNPQYGVDANGNPVILQLNKAGTATTTKLPDGVKLSKEPIKLDAGTEFVLLDPVTRQPVGRIPKDVAGEASANAAGKAQGEAVAALPQVEGAGQQMLGTIDSLLADPYLDSMVGPIQGRWLPNLSADAARVQSKMDQLTGQSFLQAYNQLRGGGQITEVEGQKATAAMARLNAAQSEQDYRAALGELRSIVQSAVARARQKAGGAAPETAPAAAPTVINGYTIEEIR